MRGAEPQARYGEVWMIGHTERPDDPPPEPFLVVSGDLYNESGLGVIGVQVLDEATDGTLHEPIPGIGSAQFDMVAWFPPGWLVEQVGELDPDRHAEVARLIRNLIGNG